MANGLRHAEGAGLGHGEPPETAWSNLVGWARRTMHMSLVGRLVVLEAALEGEAMQKRSGVIRVLVNMLKKAESVLDEALKERDSVLAEAANSGHTFSDIDGAVSVHICFDIHCLSIIHVILLCLYCVIHHVIHCCVFLGPPTGCK